jgi:peptidoglycan/LPS O-acetylase OafA/YrhL
MLTVAEASPMREGRIYGLDILRAFSILTVVYAHGFVLVKDHVNATIYHLLEYDGVGIFFVLSGYLIGKILLDLAEQTDFSWAVIRGFWVRRWFRTLPNYMLVLCALLGFAVLSGQPLPSQWPLYFVFLQNAVTPHPALFPEAWSLSIEEWFYLLFPVCLFGALRWARNRNVAVVATIAVFLIIPTLLRITKATVIGYTDAGTWNEELRKLVVLRLDSVVYGVWAAYIHRMYPAVWAKYRRPAFILGFVLLTFDKSQWFYIEHIFYRQYLTFTVTGVGPMLLLPLMSSIRSGTGVLYEALTFISKISYAMYVLHLSVVLLIIVPWCVRLMDFGTSAAGSFSAYAVFWVVSVVLSFLVFRFFERPMMNLRDRFSPRARTR